MGAPDVSGVSGSGEVGGAFVFIEPTTGWVSTTNYAAELNLPGTSSSSPAGYSVALSSGGSTALINIAFDSADVFVEPTSGWATTDVPAASLTPPSISSPYGGCLGVNFIATYDDSLSANGQIALIGAPGQSAAYLYTEPQTGWAGTPSYTAQFLPLSSAGNGQCLGYSTSLSPDGTEALLGDPSANPNSTESYAQGAAYLLTTDDNWSSETMEELAPTSGELASLPGYLGWDLVLNTDESAMILAPGGLGETSLPAQVMALSASNLSGVLDVPSTVETGGDFKSQYVLTNSSATATGPVSVNLPVPANAVYVAGTSSQGSCTFTSPNLNCSLGSIPGGGGTASATLSLQADAGSQAAIVPTGFITDGVPDLSESGHTTILPPPPTLTGFTNLTVAESESGQETFRFTGTSPLVVSVQSSNTGLVPPSGISGANLCTSPGNCTLTLTPTAGATGSTTLTVTATDPYAQTGTGSFTMTVLPSPVAAAQSLTTYEGTALSGTVSASAPNGDPLNYAIVDPPAHGTVTLTATTGAFVYTPNAGYTGPDSFGYVAKDTVTGLTSKPATVSLTIRAAPASSSSSSSNSGSSSLGPLTLLALLLATLGQIRIRRLRRSRTES